MSCVDCSAKNPLAVKSSLIDPDGGSLVDLVVSESQMDLKTLEAESMPKLKITKVDLEWVHVLSEGWASPLMREDEYLQSLHFNCLRMKDGSIVNMSLPIVLVIDDQAKERIGASIHVALVGLDGDLVGVLRSWQKISDPGSIAEVLEQVYADHSTEVDKVFSRILETAQHPAAAASFVSIMCQVNDVPICLMYGKEDPWVKPVWGLQVKRRLPEAPYYEISPAGHCPHDEVPEVFLDPFDVNFNLTHNFLLQAMSLNCYLHFFVCPRYALDDIGYGSHVHLSLCQS
ncbi:hypothetical protein CsSME_00012017 [Camellia sinensis var. sinensis]